LGSISDGATSEFPSLTERSQTVASSSQAAFRVIDAMNRNRQAFDLFLLRRDHSVQRSVFAATRFALAAPSRHD
jgi:hypothetical protein